MLDPVDTSRPFYAARLGEPGHARQVGWRDASAQTARFSQFLRVIREGADRPISVADIGCGLGDLLPFLEQAAPVAIDYRGYDILPEMVERARRLHRDSRCTFAQIRDISKVAPADYCFASGIFNQKLGHPDDIWWAHVQQCIRQLAARSEVAAAFNLLSSYSDEDRRDPSLFYADPCLVFDWCKREISTNVALLHDYGHWDFTIVVKTDQRQRPEQAT